MTITIPPIVAVAFNLAFVVWLLRDRIPPRKKGKKR